MSLQVIRGDLLENIQTCVNCFVKQTKVRCAIVADKSGQLITQVGFASSLDVRALAALVSGIFVSGEELAKLLGKFDFVVLYHEGRHMSIFFSLVASDYIFVSIFDDRTNMGVVQIYAKELKEGLGPMEAAEKEDAKTQLEADLLAGPDEGAKDRLADDDLDAFFDQGMKEDEEKPDKGSEDLDFFGEGGGENEPKAASSPVEDGPSVAVASDPSLKDSLEDLFGFGEAQDDPGTGDDLSRLFDDIVNEPSEETPGPGTADQKSLRDGLEDLFNL